MPTFMPKSDGRSFTPNNGNTAYSVDNPDQNVVDQFARGWTSSSLGDAAGAAYFEANKALAAGDRAKGLALKAEGDRLSLEAAKWSPKVQGLENISSLRDAFKFTAGNLGQLQSSVKPAAMGLGGAAVGSLVGMPWLGGLAGGLAGSYDMNSNEQMADLMHDKDADKLSPQQKLETARLIGAAMSPLDVAGEAAALLGPRQLLKKVVKNSSPMQTIREEVAKKGAARYIAEEAALGHVAEGFPEAGQDLIAQKMKNEALGNPDKPVDWMSVANNYAGGAIMGTAMGGVGAVPRAMMGKALGDPSAPKKSTEDRIADAGGTLGSLAAKGMGLFDKMGSPNAADPDYMRMNAPATQGEPEAVLADQDARIAAGTRLAQKIVNHEGSSQADKTSALTYLGSLEHGVDSDSAFNTFKGDLQKNDEKRWNLENFKEAFDQFKRGTERKGNAQGSAASGQGNSQLVDLFGKKNSKVFDAYGVNFSQDPEGRASAEALFDWVQGGFHNFDKVSRAVAQMWGKDAATMVEDAYKYSVAEGLVGANEKISDILQKIKAVSTRGQSRLDEVGNLVRPTVQENMTTRQLKALDHLLNQYGAGRFRGDKNELLKEVASVFGGNAETVLKMYEPHQEELLMGEETQDPESNIQADEAPIKYHGNGSVGFDTHFDAVKNKMRELKATLHPDTFEVGAWTKLKQELQESPEALKAQEDELLKKYGNHPSVQAKGSRKQKLKAINEKVRFLAEPSGHETEAVDFTPQDIKDVESKGGKDNQYGTVEHGRLILERQVEDRSQQVTDPETGEMSFGKKTKEFSVHAGTLVKKMRGAAKRFGFDDSLNDQNVSTSLRHLKAGLSSLMNTGEFTGRVGYRETPNGEVQWLKDGELPRNLNIFTGLSVADAKKVEMRKAAERGNKTEYAEDKQGNEPAAVTKQERKVAVVDEFGNKIIDKNVNTTDDQGYLRAARRTEMNGEKSTDTKVIGPRFEMTTDEEGVKHEAQRGFETEEKPADERDSGTGDRGEGFDRDMTGQAIPERDITPTVGRKQTKFITDLLNKGVPAFVSAVKKMTADQQFKVRAALRELFKRGKFDGDLKTRAENALKALRGDEKVASVKQDDIAAETDKHYRSLIKTELPKQNTPIWSLYKDDGDGKPTQFVGYSTNMGAAQHVAEKDKLVLVNEMSGNVGAGGAAVEGKVVRGLPIRTTGKPLSISELKLIVKHSDNVLQDVKNIFKDQFGSTARKLTPKERVTIGQAIQHLVANGLPQEHIHKVTSWLAYDKGNRSGGDGVNFPSTGAVGFDQALLANESSGDIAALIAHELGHLNDAPNAVVTTNATQFYESYDSVNNPDYEVTETDDYSNPEADFYVPQGVLIAEFVNAYRDVADGSLAKMILAYPMDTWPKVNGPAKRHMAGYYVTEAYAQSWKLVFGYKDVPVQLKDGSITSFEKLLPITFKTIKEKANGITTIAGSTSGNIEAVQGGVQPTLSSNADGAHGTRSENGNTRDEGSAQGEGSGSEIGGKDSNGSGLKPNAQSATGETITPEQQTNLREQMVKTLGDKIKLEFAKLIKGTKGEDWSGEHSEGLIRIALNALNPSGVLDHEMTHELFRIMRDAGAQDVIDLLQNVANNKLVSRQLYRELDGHPAAQEQLKNPEEAAAYLYQFWQMGKIQLGPKSETVLQKLGNFLRSIFNLVSQEVKDQQMAQAVMQAFREGKIANKEVSEAAKVMREAMADARAKASNKFLEVLKTNKMLTNAVFTAGNVLRDTGNPHFIKIAEMFHEAVDDKASGQDLYRATAQYRAQYLNKLTDILRDVDKEDLPIALRHLQAGTGLRQITDPEIRRIVEGVRKHLDDMYAYMESRGMKRWDEDSRAWVPVKKINDNYFPQVWNVDKIAENPQAFIDKLKEHHSKTLEMIAQQANEEVKSGKYGDEYSASTTVKGREITADDIAQAITSRLINAGGAEDITESTSSLGITPYARSVNKRSLNWIEGKHFTEFMDDDLVKVMTNYTAQIVKRGEYTTRFGNEGEKLQRMVDDAFLHQAFDGDQKKMDAAREEYERQMEVWEHMSDRKAESKPSLKWVVRNEISEEKFMKTLEFMKAPLRAIMAGEGTLGREIDNNVRTVLSGMMTYQNFRLMTTALFSSFVDPTGIVVNGGKVNEAFDAFKRGVKEVLHLSTEKDDMARLAEKMGIVDASICLEALGQTYSSLFMFGKMKRANDALFKYNGMEAWNRAMRIAATGSAIGFIERHLTSPNQHSERYLKDELGLAGNAESYMKDGKLDTDNVEVQHAIMKWVDGAILRPNAMQRPIIASDPHYALFYHLKQFTYSFHKTIIERTMHEFAHGNITPALSVVAGYMPVIIAADALKAMLLPGDQPAWMRSLGGVISHGWDRSGFGGIPQLLLDDMPVVGKADIPHLFGPMVDQAAGILATPFSPYHTVSNEFLGAMPAGTILKKFSPAPVDPDFSGHTGVGATLGVMDDIIPLLGHMAKRR